MSDYRLNPFKPSATATSREIRLSGLFAMAVGTLILALGIALMTSVKWNVGASSRPLKFIVGAPVAGGYVLMMTGLYRAVTGKTAEQASTSVLASLGRILFGLVFVIATIGVVIFVSVRLSQSAPPDYAP